LKGAQEVALSLPAILRQLDAAATALPVLKDMCAAAGLTAGAAKAQEIIDHLGHAQQSTPQTGAE
jgi:hypothetical protein